MDATPCFDGPNAELDALAEADRWQPAPGTFADKLNPPLMTIGLILCAQAIAVKAVGKAAPRDAVSQLVEIWGSKELFVNEYR